MLKSWNKVWLSLLLFNSFILLWGLIILEARFLIALLAFLLLFQAFLCVFSHYYLKKYFSFSSFPKKDPYGVSKLFQQIQKNYPHSKLELLKSPEGLCLYWSLFFRSKLSLSEDFLEAFSQKEKAFFLSYVFRLEQSGDLFFISFFSAFLFVFQKIARILTYPLIFKARRVEKSEKHSPLKIYDSFSLYLFSFFMKSFLYRADQELLKTKEEKGEQALFLWKLDSFMKWDSGPALPLFLAPLCLVSPLKSHFSSYYPTSKQRIKKLLGHFPP